MGGLKVVDPELRLFGGQNKKKAKKGYQTEGHSHQNGGG